MSGTTFYLADVLKATTYLVEALDHPGQWSMTAYLEAINWATQDCARITRLTWTSYLITIGTTGA